MVDDELILFRDDGYYLATPEGAHFVHLKFPGVSGYHSFHQFKSVLDKPKIIKATLAGSASLPAPNLTPPPVLNFASAMDATASGRAAKVSYRASSDVGLKQLRVFVDGRLANQEPLTGRSASGTVSVDLPPEARWIAAVAVDVRGFESVAYEAPLDRPSDATESKLHVVSFGTDEYRDRAFQNLTGAGQDASSVKQVLTGQPTKQYARVDRGADLDIENLREDLPRRLREVVAMAKPNDTILVFAAGHGEVGPDGRFYLATYDTKKDDLANTALAWDEIAKAFDGVKARVIVLLDACRAGTSGFITNDDAAKALTTRSDAIAVIAASKGRQNSLEPSDGSGGFFTNAVVAAIKDRARTDSNGNGVIELDELYGAIKGAVVDQSKGRQTPWIARNRMVGPVPLF